MVKIRKGIAYRRIERPYTRKSKFKKKSFVKASPHNKIIRYEMGDVNKKFKYNVTLVSKTDLQIRDAALESARQSSNRFLEEKLGKNRYHMRLRKYPHHTLRENPLASGAGADRMSTGMAASFGKVIGIAAQVFKRETVFEVNVDDDGLNTAKTALIMAKNKLPNSYWVVVKKNQ